MPGTLDLAPDVLVARRYRLLEPLARGATASVWRARDLAEDRDVAVKVLRDDGVDPVLRTRAEREASVLTGISHPNLVTVLDSGDDEGRPYLAMELLEGAALDTVLAERGRLPVDEAVNLVADVADGLGVAHEHGVVHRDVKPGNIVCHDDVPTLVDFGIARSLDSTTLTRGLVVGTAKYLAPEQAQGFAVTPAADVYALGCVLYELVVGEPPFTGESPVSIAVHHVQSSPVPPGDRVDVPAAVDAVVMRALSKEPAARPMDGHALAAALRGALATEPKDETVAIAPVVKDATAVMPVVTAAAMAPDDPLVDPSPLHPPPPSQPIRPTPMLIAGAVVAAVVLIGLVLLVAGHGNDAPTTPTSTTLPANANVTVRVAPTVTVAPVPVPRPHRGKGHKGG